MPEDATIEEVEEIYFQGWKLGLKALAIYRDNCKVGQPLSDGKAKKAEEAGGRRRAGAERRRAPPVRKRLPKRRPSQTVSFSVGGAEGYMTAGSYPDDGLGEVFLKLGKQGSTLAGVMDAFSIAISIALQYGVPLEAYVSKFVNMRFEPAGLTDDPDVRMAQSMMDYIFRRLALDYLPYDDRSALGIFTAEERAATVAGYDAAPTAAPTASDDVAEGDLEGLAQSAPIEHPAVQAAESGTSAGGGSGAASPARPASTRRPSCWRRLPARPRTPAVPDLRDQDAAGRQLLCLRGLWQHQRLLVAVAERRAPRAPPSHCGRAALGVSPRRPPAARPAGPRARWRSPARQRPPAASPSPAGASPGHP